MTTELMKQREERYHQDNKQWKITVINNETHYVETLFTSDQHTLANILHKIKLDLMSNLYLNLKSDITIRFNEIK